LRKARDAHPELRRQEKETRQTFGATSLSGPVRKGVDIDIRSFRKLLTKRTSAMAVMKTHLLVQAGPVQLPLPY